MRYEKKRDDGLYKVNQKQRRPYDPAVQPIVKDTLP